MNQEQQSQPQRDFHGLFKDAIKVKPHEWEQIGQEVLPHLSTEALEIELWKRRQEAAPAVGAIAMQGDQEITTPEFSTEVESVGTIPTKTSSDVESAVEVPEAAAVDIERLPYGEELTSAYNGYKAMLNDLNEVRSEAEEELVPIASEEAVAAEFAAWMTQEKQEYIAAVQGVEPPGQPEQNEVEAALTLTLVATPNILVSAGELHGIVDEFAKKQPGNPKANVATKLYEQYTEGEISGARPTATKNNAVVFTLIPTETTTELRGSVAQQRQMLKEAQQNGARSRVASPLESVAYWYTLRDIDDSYTVGPQTQSITHTRHFSMEEHRTGLVGGSSVPETYITDEGVPVLGQSGMGGTAEARLVIN